MKLKIKVLQISLLAFLTMTFSFLACNKEKSGEGTPDQEEAASVASSESDGEAEDSSEEYRSQVRPAIRHPSVGRSDEHLLQRRVARRESVAD